MNFQIDVKPPIEPGNAFYIHMYIDGACYQFLSTKSTVEDLKNNGIVKQVMRSVRNDDGVIEQHTYENGLDGAGVKYTSKEFKLK